MKYYPALFNDAMVRAILAGHGSRFWWKCGCADGALLTTGELVVRSPLGGPGDRLWVRECWGLSMNDHAHECLSYRADQGERREPQMMRLWDPSLKRWELSETESPSDEPEKWRSSRHMPRWASRITLEVLDVRAERIQEITNEDARAEGVETDPWVWAYEVKLIENKTAREP